MSRTKRNIPTRWFWNFHANEIEAYNWERHRRTWWCRLDETDEEIWERVCEEFAKKRRDGYVNDTANNTGFKTDANRRVRRENKKFCRKVLRDDWEHDPNPIAKEGNKYKWDYWW